MQEVIRTDETRRSAARACHQPGGALPDHPRQPRAPEGEEGAAVSIPSAEPAPRKTSRRWSPFFLSRLTSIRIDREQLGQIADGQDPRPIGGREISSSVTSLVSDRRSWDRLKFKLARQLVAIDCLNPKDYENLIEEVIVGMSDGGVDYSS